MNQVSRGLFKIEDHDDINLPGTYPKWLISIIDDQLSGQLDCTKVFRMVLFIQSCTSALSNIWSRCSPSRSSKIEIPLLNQDQTLIATKLQSRETPTAMYPITTLHTTLQYTRACSIFRSRNEKRGGTGYSNMNGCGSFGNNTYVYDYYFSRTGLY